MKRQALERDKLFQDSFRIQMVNQLKLQQLERKLAESNERQLARKAIIEQLKREARECDIAHQAAIEQARRDIQERDLALQVAIERVKREAQEREFALRAEIKICSKRMTEFGTLDGQLVKFQHLNEIV